MLTKSQTFRVNWLFLIVRLSLFFSLVVCGSWLLVKHLSADANAMPVLVDMLSIAVGLGGITFNVRLCYLHYSEQKAIEKRGNLKNKTAR